MAGAGAGGPSDRDFVRRNRGRARYVAHGGTHPQTLADAPQRREQAIGTLIEKVFDSHDEPPLRHALKTFYPKVLEAQRIGTKLDQRPRAA
jgi:hypothetical protein